jgi:hypothetical protein
MSLLNFNASEVAPSIGFTPIPAGRYVAVINDSGMRPTKSGNGQYLQLEFEIIEGEHAGRRLWDRLNLENTNPEAVRIARADLSAICHAVNVLTPQDSVELHNIPLVIVVKCKRNQDDEVVSEIKGYEAHAPAQPAEPAPAVAPAPASTPTRYSALRDALARRVQQPSPWTRNLT